MNIFDRRPLGLSFGDLDTSIILTDPFVFDLGQRVENFFGDVGGFEPGSSLCYFEA